MRTVFMGTPDFAVPALEHMVINRQEVVAVYTQPDRAAGRSRAPLAPPVKKAALALGLPVFQPESLKQGEAIAQLAALKPELIVVAAFGQILPQAVLDIPRYGCINLHPSLLPSCRGASPVAAAIFAGSEFTGVSVMLLDKGMDTGPVLGMAAVPISSKDDTGLLTFKLSQVAARFLQEILVRWTRGEIKPRPQNQEQATYCSLITKEAGEIDWRLPAVEIWRRVRAFSPWPGCYTRWRGKQLKIVEAAPLPGQAATQAGQVTALGGSENPLGIGTGDGLLGVSRLQLEGKQAMTAAEFLRGQREFVGSVLPS